MKFNHSPTTALFVLAIASSTNATECPRFCKNFHDECKPPTKTVEVLVKYEAYNDPDPICTINFTVNYRRRCILEILVPETMEPPIGVYYEIEMFSRYDSDSVNCFLKGQTSNCMFNDMFTVLPTRENTNNITLIEDGIARQSDLMKFAQPVGFHSTACPSCGEEDCSCEKGNWSCGQPFQDEDGNCFLYYYPNDKTTTYPYEDYPNIISPIEGVTNEHYMVWMGTKPTYPRFRKLYGWINQSIPGGTKLSFEVEANWVVMAFKGSKALVLSNQVDCSSATTVISTMMCLVFLDFLFVLLFSL